MLNEAPGLGDALVYLGNQRVLVGHGWLRSVRGRCCDGSADLLNDRVGDQEEINKQEGEQKADA